MSRADELLKETIDELAGEVRAVDNLAALAMERGRRLRLRRRFAVCAGTVAALALVVAAPFVVLRGNGGQVPPAAEITVSEREPVDLIDGWHVVGVGHWVLDQTARAYVELAAVPAQSMVIPAPTGGLTAFIGRANDGNTTTIEFVKADGSVTQKATLNDSNGVYQWSPGGDRLVTTTFTKSEFSVAFAIIDAASGEIRRHPVDQKYDCSMCQFVWTREGREVALGIAARRGGEAHEFFSGIQMFDAQTGNPTRSVAIEAMFTSPYSWSPSGRYVIAQADGLTRKYQLIDVTTGKAVPFPYNAVWTSDEHLVAAADGAVLVLRPDGSVIQRYPFDGKFLDTGPVTFGPPA